MILMSLSQSILSHVRGIADTVLINALAREGDDAEKPKEGAHRAEVGERELRL
jgi:hypothetical protein